MKRTLKAQLKGMALKSPVHASICDHLDIITAQLNEAISAYARNNVTECRATLEAISTRIPDMVHKLDRIKTPKDITGIDAEIIDAFKDDASVDCAIELALQVSRRFGIELTVIQAGKLFDKLPEDAE